MLKHLPDESNISRRQLVLYQVQCLKLDVQVLKPSPVKIDQAWHDVASDVSVAQNPDLGSYSEIATSEVDYVRFGCKGT